MAMTAITIPLTRHSPGFQTIRITEIEDDIACKDDNRHPSKWFHAFKDVNFIDHLPGATVTDTTQPKITSYFAPQNGY